MFLYKDTGNAFFLAEISHRFYFVLGDGTFIDYLFPDKAVSPVHGDISINQIPTVSFEEATSKEVIQMTPFITEEEEKEIRPSIPTCEIGRWYLRV